MRRLLWVLVLFTLCGCRGGGLQEKDLVGRWVEEKENLRIEFTANKLYAKREPNVPVEVGLWSLKNGQVEMRSFMGPEVTTWRPRLEQNEFIIDQGEAQFRRFKRLKSSGSIFDNGLVGLWRSYDDHPQIIEFTERGTFVGLFQRLDKEGNLFLVGVQSDVLTAGQSQFYLEGYMGTKRTFKGYNAHPYALEGSELIWKRKASKAKPKVYRKVSSVDLEEFVGKGTPQPDPSKTP